MKRSSGILLHISSLPGKYGIGSFGKEALNYFMKRSSGILLHISSLPGKYGIGSFGKEALKFSKFLKEMGFTWWQTLPFGTTDDCNSPYKSFSAFAGNPLFIDLQTLAEKGFLTEDELKENECSTTDDCNSPYKSFSAFAGNPLFIDLQTLAEKGFLTEDELKENECSNPYFVNFEWLNKTRYKIFHLAYERIDENEKNKIKEFENKNKHWLPDFALYMTLREKNNNTDWYLWKDEELKFHKKEAVEKAFEKYADEVFFHEFLQYEFYSQWEKIKSEINKNGIKMIGDMPIYVSLESADVWANRELFDLSEDGSPRLVAGVPPDYFSEEGQMWGNPLYNWELMKKQNYSWWIERIENSKQDIKFFILLMKE